MARSRKPCRLVSGVRSSCDTVETNSSFSLFAASASERARFYGRQRFALHVTDDARAPGCWSPCVGLFEAAACGVP